MKKITAFIYQILIALWRINPFKAATAKAMVTLKLPVRKLYKDLKFSGVINIKVGDGSFRIFNTGKTTIENELFWYGLGATWEPHSVEAWTKLCRQANTIFDIGANTGVYSLIACTVNPQARVFTFEPGRVVFHTLEKNRELNAFKNIRLENKAISDKSGKAVFYDFKDPGSYSASLDPTFNNYTEQDKRNQYEVETLAFDDYMRANNIESCDLLKIDVELHEISVLTGMRQTLDKYRPTLLMEILSEEIAAKAEELLNGKGYLYFKLDGDGGPVQINSLLKNYSENFLICQAQVAGKLGLKINQDARPAHG